MNHLSVLKDFPTIVQNNTASCKGLFTVGDSDRVSDFLELLALATCIHSERLAIMYRIYRELLKWVQHPFQI